MKRKAFLCIDVGISAAKAVVSSFSGKIVDAFLIPYSCEYANYVDRGYGIATSLEERIVRCEQEHSIRMGSIAMVIPFVYVYTLQKHFSLTVSSAFNPVVISERHKTRLFSLPYEGQFPGEYRLIESYPQQYSIDESAVERFPDHMKAKKIGFSSTMLFAADHFMSALEQLSSWWGVPIERVLPVSAALQGYMRRVHDDASIACVDIGKRYTHIVFEKERSFAGCVYLFCGSETVDRCIAERFDLPLSLAEEIKVMYGSLAPQEAGAQKYITIKNEEGYRKLPSSEFVLAVQGPYARIGGSIAGYLKGQGITRVLFSGGATRINGFESFFTAHCLKDSSISVALTDDQYALAKGGAYAVVERRGASSHQRMPLFRLREMLKEYF